MQKTYHLIKLFVIMKPCFALKGKLVVKNAEVEL